MTAGDNVKTIAKEGSIAFLVGIIGRILRFITQVYLARLLSIESYGLYSLGRSCLELLQLPAKLGLPNAVVRFGSVYLGSNDEKRLKGVLLSAIVLSGLFASVCSASVIAFSNELCVFFFKSDKLIPILKLFCLSLPFFVILSVSVSAFRVYKKIFYYSTISDFLSPGLNLLLVFLFIILGYGLIGAVFGFIISNAISMLISLILLKKLFPQLYSIKSPAIYETTRLLKYSTTVAFIGISHVLMSQTDRIMLGAFSNIEEVGLYNASAVIALQMTLFLTAINTIFAPMIADLYSKNLLSDIEYLFKASTKWVFTLTFIVALVVFTFSKEILSVFGNEFSVNINTLLILTAGQFINASVGAVGFILTMTGKHKIELFNSITLASLNIVLNYLLIPIYGSMGAAIATGMSVALINILRLVEVYSIYKIHPYDMSYLKPLLAGVLTIIIWQAIHQYVNTDKYLWILASITISGCYFLIILIIGLDKSDKMILKSIIKKFGS